MNIETRQLDDFEARRKKAIDKGIQGATEWKPWDASIYGPWYADSNPSGHGDTEEEARANALQRLREMHEEIGAFLKEQSA